MRSVALLPSVALLAGVSAGIAWGRPVAFGASAAVALCAAAAIAWLIRLRATTVVACTAGYLVAGALLGAGAAADALAPPLRMALHDAFGGFALEHPGPPGAHAPLVVRARLTEDAAPRDFGVTLRARVEFVTIGGAIRRAPGGLRLAVAGTAALERAREWRAGRIIEAPVTFRRPARYLNDGVPDFERDQALGGVALAGSVKSGLVVEIAQRGSAMEEVAAGVRARVRAALARHVGARDPLAGAIVTAILIGDRTGMSDEVRARLQAAGTYHVIAISGGNIAILAALMAGVLMLAGATGRVSAIGIIAGLLAYAAIVSAGPSVWRATATAVAYLAARLIDHRSPPWNAMAVSAACLACLAPLDVRDVGFALTFGATAAILEAARRVAASRHAVVAWALACVAASLAAEIVLLPIAASAFSRVTIAGLVLNLLAVPLMTVAQIAGLVVVGVSGVEPVSAIAGSAAAAAARGLVESARLVDVFPWLALRVPAPSAALVVAYYVALGCALWAPRARRAAGVAVGVCALAIVLGVAPSARAHGPTGLLRLTMFDVGQGDALLLQAPTGRAVMVDTGGAGFDGTAFDIGGRVLAPALWARGVRTLDALAITHGDPDHMGGAAAVLHDFTPSTLWHGVPVPPHVPARALFAAAEAGGTRVIQQLAGSRVDLGDVGIRVLHPPPPDWERQKVRNDDSLVLEVRYRHVAMLLTGDIGAEIERALLPALSPARIRILKIAHHGSRTSTSQELLDAWKPQIALISCGRGNRFGHPAPEVMERLEAAGVRVYRTDRDGQITVETDGHVMRVRTFVGGVR